MAALLTAVSLFALSIPLRAATRIDVLTAIREEDLALATLFVAEQLHRVGARRRGDAPSAVRMPNAQIDNTEY
jgi:hypothetical protein